MGKKKGAVLKQWSTLDMSLEKKKFHLFFNEKVYAQVNLTWKYPKEGAQGCSMHSNIIVPGLRL